jgi:hypothetical protein
MWTENKTIMKKSVLQEWVENLTYMQQSVLLTALRGPDTIRKDHVSKLLIRWMRRCILLSAFDGKVLTNPYESGGGSFIGPSVSLNYSVEQIEQHNICEISMNHIVDDYLKTVDELPHHFQLHFMHASEILGYKHPDDKIRNWWKNTYLRLVNDLHLTPESEERMDWRLGDKEEQ